MPLAIITDQIHPDLEQACKIISAYGYAFVEIHNVYGKSIEECTLSEARQIKTILDRYHLHCINLATTVFFLCPLYPDDQVSLFNDSFYCIKGDLNDHLHYLDNACQIAEILGTDTIRIFPFRFPDNETGIRGTQKDMDHIIEALQQAIIIARKYNKILVLENCPYSHLPKGEMTFQIIRKIHSPNLKLLWDPANSYRAEIKQVPKQYLNLSLDEEYNLIKHEIAHVHIKNYHYVEGLQKPFVHTTIDKGDISYRTKSWHFDHVSLEPEVSYEDTLSCMKQAKEIYR